MDLTGKTILVTGAAGTGVGAGVCQAVVEAGGKLIVNALTEEEAEWAAERYDAYPAVADVANALRIEEMFARIAGEVGVPDGLVNNAGIGLSRYAHEATEAEFDALYAIDLRGVWLLSRRFAELLLKAKRPGSIVNISSVHAVATMRRYALYAGAKAGVEGLTRGLAVELGPHRIRCNAVAPGYVHSQQNIDLIRSWTDDPEGWVRMHTLNQQAIEQEITPIECGWATVFFLSDRSRSITGQVLRVDGGMTAMLYNKDFL
jgi:NAD(P)-dependent dehydrogenase (short-subunit alcohol dehydrogenase family)